MTSYCQHQQSITVIVSASSPSQLLSAPAVHHSYCQRQQSITVTVSASSPSQPSLYQSSRSALTREQHLRYVHYRDTVGIQQNLQFVVRCGVKTEEREATRRSAKESTSPERRFGLEREPQLESKRATTSEVCIHTEMNNGASHRTGHSDIQVSRGS